MDIIGEIVVWSVLGGAITIALIVVLPAFFRMLRRNGGDLRPHFLNDGTPPPD